MNLDESIRQCESKEIIGRLQSGIVAIADEIGMDTKLTKATVKSKSKDELIDLFCKLKGLRLEQENLRLVSLLTD